LGEKALGFESGPPVVDAQLGRVNERVAVLAVQLLAVLAIKLRKRERKQRRERER
jgi:hypothetical protein